MICNSILLAVICFTCATAVFLLSTAHAVHQEMDSGFNRIATVNLASQQDLAVEVTDDIRSLRGDRMKLVATNPITYRGGPMLTNPIPVYLLYYGTWSASLMQIYNVRDFK